MWTVLVCALMVAAVSSQATEGNTRDVTIAQGTLRGHKASNYDVFEFFDVPYATALGGVDRFKAPLPPQKWEGTFNAINRRIICPQFLISTLFFMNMQEDCLVASIHVPNTNQTNLPVVVIAHGGAFLIGWGSVDRRNGFASDNNVIVITFNYRLGVHGFLCLGTEDAPGNAGMKDQVALLRWVQNNIADFGGNPNDVTITGCSAGGASVDLLLLSSMTDGLFHKVISDSGCVVNPFALQIKPLQNARNHAQNVGFSNVSDINALAEFYKTRPIRDLVIEIQYISDNSKDSYFVFQPCVEKNIGQEIFLDDAPINIYKSGNFKKLPVIYGYTKHEGLLRLQDFTQWSVAMNENFTDFLPADLQFENKEDKAEVAQKVKEFYFGNKIVNESTIVQYVDYFSDVLFISGILRNVVLRVKGGHTNIYLYEYSFTHNGSTTFPHTNGLRGADHCDQQALMNDQLFPHTLTEERIEMGRTMREIMYNFISTGNPTPPRSDSLLPTWPTVGPNGSLHYSVGSTIEIAGFPTEGRVQFWDEIYESYGAIPQPPIETIEDEPTSTPETTGTEPDNEEETTTADPNSATLKNILNFWFCILYTVVIAIAFK